MRVVGADRSIEVWKEEGIVGISSNVREVMVTHIDLRFVHSSGCSIIELLSRELNWHRSSIWYYGREAVVQKFRRYTKNTCFILELSKALDAGFAFRRRLGDL
jgi:hypothetical protein